MGFSFVGAWANGEVLPKVVRPGSLERHVEALGSKAGIWGTLAEGLEAWVFPFKAFDALEFGTIDQRGLFHSLNSEVSRQTATPVEATLSFKGEGLDLSVELFVPRSFPGGSVRFRGAIPHGHTVAMRLRPVLTPMHRRIEQVFPMVWSRQRSTCQFENRSLGTRLVFAGSALLQPERNEQGQVVLRLPGALEEGLDVSFEVESDPTGIDDARLDRLRNLRKLTYDASADYYQSLIKRMPVVRTPDDEVNQAILWAGISLDQLRIKNPDLGWGLVSGFSSSRGGTRPKYAWYFEEPTLASWAYHWLGLSSHVKEALEFLRRYHREDGKSVHEVSQSLRYWPEYFDEFKYAFMHTDGPVYYLVAYGHYLRWTGDLAFIESHWETIRQIYSWCLTQVDESDSLITVDRGDWGSAESSTEILKDTQLEAMWVRALRELAFLARKMGDGELADEAEGKADQARRALEQSFWDEKSGFYIWGVNRAGEKMRSLVPHHAIGFWLGEFRHDRVLRALGTLAGSEFMTDWGVRSLALSDPKFDESSYQSGSVWPVWNAGVIVSDYRTGQSLRAFQNWRASVETRWRLGIGPMPEVLRGDRFELLPEAVPHQMFSELAIVNGFFDGLLGLEIDVPERRIVVAPRIPADWNEIRVERIPFGQESFDLAVHQENGLLSIDIDGQFEKAVQCTFRPELPVDALIEEVSDSIGQPYFLTRLGPAARTVEIERKVAGRPYEVEIRHDGKQRVQVLSDPLETGQTNRRLRILNAERRGVWWQASLEGLEGRSYYMRFEGAQRPVEIVGGRLVREDIEGFVVETFGDLAGSVNRAGYVGWNLRVKFDDRPDRWRLMDRVLLEGTDEDRARARWNQETARIRRAMMAVMGRLPGDERRIPLSVRIVEEVDCGSYVRRLLEYQSEPGSRTPAYLLIPKDCLEGGRKANGVLCLHSTDHQIGHQVVVGLGGKPGRNYAEELAQRGFVAIAPSYPLLANYHPNLTALGYQSGTMKAIWDNIRAIDLLESLGFVRGGRYAAIGHSLGGHNAIYTAIFDPRIKTLATSCAFDSFLDYKGGDIRGWTSERYMPHLLDYGLTEIPFDFSELLGSLAPRPLFVSAPKGDTNFQWASVAKVVEAARPLYGLFGAENDLRVRHPECGHDFPRGIREEAYTFLERELKRLGD